jgi:hypothetical protein
VSDPDRGNALFLIAAKDLVAGFAGDARFPAEIAHALAFKEPGDETQPSFHGINTSWAGGPAQEVSPMCPEQTVTYVSERSPIFRS